MIARADFTAYWAAHGDESIDTLTARLIWTDAQRVERGWGVLGSCRKCGTDEVPRYAKNLCRRCYQQSRYNVNKKQKGVDRKEQIV